jgi:hypothetical protein
VRLYVKFLLKEAGVRTRILPVLVAVTALAACLAAGPARAQEQTGSIEGVVRDQQGGILPGASVSARNLAVGAAVDLATDGNGAFRFAALSPGFYDVTATLDGFTPAKFERVEVLLGQVKRLDFALAVGSLTETVQVSAASPLVDVKQNARGFSLRSDQLEYLPRGVDYTSVVQFMPGTNVEPKLGGISVDGASAAENRFVIDGVDTTNLMNGLPGAGYRSLSTLDVDSVEELQVKSSGYSAEYGGATGGVINVLTKSGTNAWHGDARLYFSGDALDAGPRPNLRRSLTVVNEAEYFTYPEDPYTRFQPGFSLGGPIHRDLAWFFASYQPTLQHIERTVTFALDGSTTTRAEDDRQHLFTASQTLQLGSKLRTRAAVTGSPASSDGLLPAQAGTDSPVSNFDVQSSLPYWTVTGTTDLLATSSFFVSGRVGYMYRNLTNDNVRSTPRYTFPVTNIGLLDVPPELQRVTGFTTDTNNYEYVKDVQSRLAMQIDATWYVRAWGEHSLKAGVQADWTTNDTDRGFKANVVSLAWNRAFQGKRGKYGYYTLTSNLLEPRRGQITIGKAQGSTTGLFVQDAWRIGRKLTVNVGLRSEREAIPNYSIDGSEVPPMLEFGFADKLAPRLGAAYDVTGDGRWKIYGSWGIFYDIFKYSLSTFTAIYGSVYRYTLDTYDWPNLLNDTACPPSCPGTMLSTTGTLTNPELPFDPSLDPMRSQEAVVGVEHQWKPNLLLTARYVHKQLDRAIDDIGALDAQGNEVYTIGNPGYGIAQYAYPGVRLPKAVRDYDAVEIGARRLMTRRWAFAVSYLWSRLYGNYSGLSQSDEDGRVSPNVGRVYDNAFVMFDEKARPVYGLLATDRPHQLKANVVYEAPFRMSVGVYQFLASGLPVTREIAVVQGSNFPMMYLGRLSDGRTPALSQTDLYVQQDIGAWRNSRFSVGLSVTNLFDQDTVISKYIVKNEAGYAIGVTEDQFFAGQFDVDQAMAAQGINDDARFLLPNAYQAPRTARIMAKWSF